MVTMRIGILSDTHSRYALVARALRVLQVRHASVILHCGDIDDAQTVAQFEGWTAHFVLGNCDRNDAVGLRRAITRVGATLHEEWGYLELKGVKIAFLHGDDTRLLHDLEQSTAFDFLFYGHTHQAKEHLTGATRVINPGALYRVWPKTVALLDLASGGIETVKVE
jgi:putative phosphoesterase